jgi:hypothetical protein
MAVLAAWPSPNMTVTLNFTSAKGCGSQWLSVRSRLAAWLKKKSKSVSRGIFGSVSVCPFNVINSCFRSWDVFTLTGRSVFLQFYTKLMKRLYIPVQQPELPKDCSCKMSVHTLLWNTELRTYRGADKSLARPTSRCILFDGENISFDASLVIYIYSTDIPPTMIIGYMKIKICRCSLFPCWSG